MKTDYAMRERRLERRVSRAEAKAEAVARQDARDRMFRRLQAAAVALSAIGLAMSVASLLV